MFEKTNGVFDSGRVLGYKNFYENTSVQSKKTSLINKQSSSIDKNGKDLSSIFQQVHYKTDQEDKKTKESNKNIFLSQNPKIEADKKINRLSQACLPPNLTVHKIISDFTEVRLHTIQKDFPKETSAPFSHLLCFFQSKSIQNSSMHGPINSQTVADHRHDVSSETKHLKASTEASHEAFDDKQFSQETQIVSCGSVSLTSDNDYTFLTPPGKKASSAPVKLRNSNSKTNHVEETVTIYQQLMGKVKPNYNVTHLLQDSTPPSLRSLTPEQRVNAINALAQADFNWFNALEKYAEQPQIIWDIRSLEIEITKNLSQAINTTYVNLSESDMVEKMNSSIRQIFGKESGVLFDTNYYTAHAILQEGFKLNTPSMEQRWVKSNEMQSLVKVASNYKALYGSKDAFFALCKHSNIEEKAALQAWDKMEVRESAIEMHSQAVREKGQQELQQLQDKLSSLLDPEKEGQIKAKINSIATKLGDEEQVKLEAMNDLYMSGLQFTEEKNKSYISAQKLLDQKIAEFSSHLDESKKEQFSKTLVTGKWDEALALLFSKPAVGKERLTPQSARVCLQVLQELTRARDRAASDVVDVQMSTLLFANEPYYSQATVVAVVAGMQMKKTASEYPLLANSLTYKFSMIENFGDFAKDKAHYKEDPEKFVFRSSKYLSRTISSAKEHMAKAKNGELKKEIEHLEKLSGGLLALRRSEESDLEKKQKSMALLNQYLGDQSDKDPTAMVDRFFSHVEEVVSACSRQREE